jgi:hypothetical protein
MRLYWMVIVEQLQFFKHMLFQYISVRFEVLKFASFTVLLVLLGVTEMPEWRMVAENYLFVMGSLFAFRLLDDAWSFHLDRIEHPQRTYLHPENFIRFILFSSVTFAIYLTGLFLISGSLGAAILTLLLVSCGLYLLFFKNKHIMTLIPLLKYPVLVWCISRFGINNEVLCMSAGAFFMMLTADYTDGNTSSGSLKYTILLALITGILIFQPWNIGLSLIVDLIILTIPIFLLIFIPVEKKGLLPILIFPLLHLLNVIISL